MCVKMISLAWPLNMATGLKYVLVSICDAANDDGEAFLCIETIAFKTSLSVRAVQSHIKELERIGFIRKDERPGRSSVFSVDLAYMIEAEKHPLWIKRELLRGKKFKTTTACERPLTGAESAPLAIKNTACERPLTGAESAPAPAESAPAPADSAPITVSYPSLNKETHAATKSKQPKKIEADGIGWDVPDKMFKGITAERMEAWQRAFPGFDVEGELTRIDLWYERRLRESPKFRWKNAERGIHNWLSRAYTDSKKPKVFVKQQAPATQPTR